MKTKTILYIHNFTGTLGLTCEGCGSIIKIPLEDVAASIKCQCGLGYVLSEDDIKDARISLNDITLTKKSTLKTVFT